PFGSFTVPLALQVKALATAAPQGSTSASTLTNDPVLFHPMLTRLLQDVLEKELNRESAKPAGSVPEKDMFLAFDACLVYLVQVLSRTVLQKRRCVLDAFIPLLGRCARASFAIASRCLERLSIRAETFVKPILFECPSRA